MPEQRRTRKEDPKTSRARAQRWRAWGRQTRIVIVNILRSIDGDYCQCCQEKFKPTEYELDHINPNYSAPYARRMDAKGRTVDYLKNLKRDNLQLLCSECNKAKGRNHWDYRKDNNPF